MNIGDIIRSQRKRKNLTQAELGKACGLSESAIRNYELGNRVPNEATITKISSALSVSPSVFSIIPTDSVRDTLEILFRLEDKFGLTPFTEKNSIYLKIDKTKMESPKLEMAINAWIKTIDLKNNGQLTDEEYSEWRDSFKE